MRKTGENFQAVAVCEPDFDAPALSLPAPGLGIGFKNKNLIAFPLEHEGFFGNDQRISPRFRDDVNRGKHPRPQQVFIRSGNFNGHFHRAAFGIHHRADHLHRARKFPFGRGFNRNACGLPHRNFAEVLFRDLNAREQGIEFGDGGHDLIVGNHIAQFDISQGHNACDGRHDRRITQREFGLFE